MTNKSGEQLLQQFNLVRDFSERLCKPLATEDFIVQSMPDVSPTRWHLAHTSWFFETFLLKPMLKDYQTPNELFNYLFNSYYNAISQQFPRPKRGLLSRPTVKEIFAYRHHVDTQVARLFDQLENEKILEITPVFTLGLNHEQQHQELMLTDIKHVFSQNPLYPVYSKQEKNPVSTGSSNLSFVEFQGGRVQQGYSGTDFSFDNETPSHEFLLQPFALADRLVTNREYLAFIEDSGYQQPHLWLSDGWALIQKENWRSPLYWIKRDNVWHEFTLSGLLPVNMDAPVVHVSYYEADAYANWCGARLPNEYEWEEAASNVPLQGNFVQNQHFHPTPLHSNPGEQLGQMYGDVWEWTRSPYTSYPGFKPATGAIGEYNGKFMSNQMVLRGGSCASSHDHLRATYRNFFYPHSRWQFMGIRLARGV